MSWFKFFDAVYNLDASGISALRSSEQLPHWGGGWKRPENKAGREILVGASRPAFP